MTEHACARTRTRTHISHYLPISLLIEPLTVLEAFYHHADQHKDRWFDMIPVRDENLPISGTFSFVHFLVRLQYKILNDEINFQRLNWTHLVIKSTSTASWHNMTTSCSVYLKLTKCCHVSYNIPYFLQRFYAVLLYSTFALMRYKSIDMYVLQIFSTLFSKCFFFYIYIYKSNVHINLLQIQMYCFQLVDSTHTKLHASNSILYWNLNSLVHGTWPISTSSVSTLSIPLSGNVHDYLILLCQKSRQLKWK